MRHFVITVPDDFPEYEGAFLAIVHALQRAEIPAHVEERDESQTIIYNAAQVDAAFRRILES